MSTNITFPSTFMYLVQELKKQLVVTEKAWNLCKDSMIQKAARGHHFTWTENIGRLFNSFLTRREKINVDLEEIWNNIKSHENQTLCRECVNKAMFTILKWQQNLKGYETRLNDLTKMFQTN